MCSDIILSQNSEDIQTALREGICAPHKIKYLGNGIDLTRFDPQQVTPTSVARIQAELGLAVEERVVGFVGRLVREKGVTELLAAIPQVRAAIPHVRFLFVGPIDVDKPDAITPEIAHHYGVAEFCCFTGRRTDLPELLAVMDVLALPSYREGFPRAPMEAAAMGVPCVVTDIRGCREVVEASHNGLLVPVRDAASLAQALIMLLRNDEQRLAMGRAGRQRALERFDEQLVFEKVKQEYVRLLAAKGIGD